MHLEDHPAVILLACLINNPFIALPVPLRSGCNRSLWIWLLARCTTRSCACGLQVNPHDISPWYPHDIPMKSHDIPLISPWYIPLIYPHDIPMISPWYPHEIPWYPLISPWYIPLIYAHDIPMISPWYPLDMALNSYGPSLSGWWPDELTLGKIRNANDSRVVNQGSIYTKEHNVHSHMIYIIKYIHSINYTYVYIYNISVTFVTSIGVRPAKEPEM